MKTLVCQYLLISAAMVAIGCAEPQSNLRLEERLVANGYPPGYVDGLTVGAESVCADISTGKFPGPTPLEVSVRCMNIGKNLKAKIDEARNGRSYQQGVADGKTLMFLAIDVAIKAEAQRNLQFEQNKLQADNAYWGMKELMREQHMRNLQMDKFNK